MFLPYEYQKKIKKLQNVVFKGIRMTIIHCFKPEENPCLAILGIIAEVLK